MKYGCYRCLKIVEEKDIIKSSLSGYLLCEECYNTQNKMFKAIIKRIKNDDYHSIRSECLRIENERWIRKLREESK